MREEEVQLKVNGLRRMKEWSFRALCEKKGKKREEEELEEWRGFWREGEEESSIGICRGLRDGSRTEWKMMSNGFCRADQMDLNVDT